MPTTPLPTRPGRWIRRLGASGLVVLLVVVVLPAVLGGRHPLAAVGVAPGCAEAAEGEQRIGIVVDAGTEPGAVGGVDVACVVVPAGATGADVLRAWAAARGRPLRYAPSGLLCGIGGYPATGCGETTADGYRYWSYWEGRAGAWQYSSGNPHVLRANVDRVEGWRFQTASGTGADDQPPRGPAGGICPPVVAPPPTAAPTTVAPVASTAPLPAPTVAPTPGGPPASVGAPSPVAGPLTPPIGDTPSSTAGAASPSSPAAGGPVVDGDGSAEAGDGSDGAVEGDGSDGAGDPQTADASASASGGGAADGVDVIDGTELAATDGLARADGGGGPPVGALVGVALIVALGVAGGLRARRRQVS